MRRKLGFGIGLAALCGVQLSASAADVLATSAPPAPVAQLGTPRAQSAPGALAPIIRAQKDDKPAAPVTVPPESTGTIPFAPTPAPGQMSPMMPGPVTVGPVVPPPGFGAPAFDMAAPSYWPGWMSTSAGDQSYRFFIGADYLYWWTKSSQFPPLVTTATPSASINTDGAIGFGNTRVIYGGDSLTDEGRSGVRATIGYWFGECKPWAIESSFLYVGPQNGQFLVASNAAGSPLIARPFVNAVTGVEDREIVAYPGLVNGNLAINTSSNFYGADVDFRRRLWCGCCVRLDGQLGFKYLHLDDDFNSREQFTYLGTDIPSVGQPQGAVGIVTDHFHTTNNFYGGMFGLVTTFKRGPWSLDLATRVSLGSTEQRVDADGSEQVYLPYGKYAPPQTGNATFAGGAYARPSNIGSFSHDSFSAVPEAAFTVGFQATPHLKLSLGYNFLYWTNVLRAGDQIDRVVDVGGIPFSGVAATTTNRPAVLFRESDYWAQGVTAGLLCTW